VSDDREASKRAWPKTQKLGEDPALDAAVAAYKALDKDLSVAEEPPVQDLSVGMGNASAYVGPTEVKPASVPAATDAAKVEFGMAEVPRALPEGSPTRETVETRVLRLPPAGPPGGEDEPTLRRQPKGRTVGGGTERLAVIEADGRRAKEAAAAPAAPVELPATRAPSTTQEPASGPPGLAGRPRGKGVVLTAVLIGLAVVIVLRVATTRNETPAEGTPARPPASAVAAATSEPIPAAARPAAAPPASIAPPVQPAGTAAAPDAREASTGAPAGAPPVSRGDRPSLGKRRPPDDPYDAAVAPISVPVVTSVPAAPATTPPPEPPTLPPAAPPSVPTHQPSAAPKAPSPFDKPNYD
jgi:hypothetical protein